MQIMKIITKQEEHVEKLLQRVRQAHKLAQTKKRDHCIAAYLNSFDAKCVAFQRVNRGRKLDSRLNQADIRILATELDAWKGTNETVLVHLKQKASTPAAFRTYMAFGIKNRALQYLVLPLLEQVADITPYQYTVRGGIHAAIKHVVKAMSVGPVLAVEVDVVDCYPSFDGKKLKGLLPVPEEVSDHVLISEYLNLQGGNIPKNVISGPFGPTSGTSFLEGKLVEARRGIPQGSAVSPLVAETMLAITLREVPDLGDKIGYGDNTLLLAKEESDMVTMLKALVASLEAHPVGLLKPKMKFFRPGEPVEFLGHCLIPQPNARIRIEPSKENRQKFERMMGRQLNRLKYEKLSATARSEAQRKAKRDVQSWTAAFHLCEGIGHYRKLWLYKIANAGAVSHFLGGSATS